MGSFSESKRHRQAVRKGREQAFEQTKRVFSFRCSPEAYLVGRKRQTRSWVPLLLAVLALAVKIFGLIVEINDPQDVGDDYRQCADAAAVRAWSGSELCRHLETDSAEQRAGNAEPGSR